MSYYSLTSLQPGLTESGCTFWQFVWSPHLSAMCVSRTWVCVPYLCLTSALKDLKRRFWMRKLGREQFLPLLQIANSQRNLCIVDKWSVHTFNAMSCGGMGVILWCIKHHTDMYRCDLSFCQTNPVHVHSLKIIPLSYNTVEGGVALAADVAAGELLCLVVVTMNSVSRFLPFPRWPLAVPADTRYHRVEHKPQIKIASISG